VSSLYSMIFVCNMEKVRTNSLIRSIQAAFCLETGKWAACALLFLIIHLAPAQAPAIPSTPAGLVLSEFLDAVNNHDSTKLQAYIRKYDPHTTVDDLLSLAADTGGFTLVSIQRSDPESISFLAREKAGGAERLGHFVLSSADSPQVESWAFRRIPPGATIEYTPLDAASRQRVMDAVISRLTQFYVYPETAQKMVAALHDHAQRGEYNSLTDGFAFAAALHHALFEVSHDAHLRVVYDPLRRPDPLVADHKPHPPSAEEIARRRADLEHSNCSFSKVEILPRNVGYLRLDGFMEPELCGATATAALNFLAHADAVIVDLRANGGGDPAMVQFIASYFFDEATHINDLYDRQQNSTTQYWTLPYVPGPRIAVPLYILTSSHTFSGAEEFAYDMQTQKRATLVGETTGGGAHPVQGMPAGDHFIIGVPFARAINPVTNKDWEGIGVEPEVKVQASDALATAQKLAGEGTRSNETSEVKRRYSDAR
jgi:retinol-binding protein 3